MAEEPYRQNLRPGLQTCTACGTPTEPARIVYSKAVCGDRRLLCGPRVIRAFGEHRRSSQRLLLLSWAGIPAVPAFFFFWQALFVLLAFVR